MAAMELIMKKQHNFTHWAHCTASKVFSQIPFQGGLLWSPQNQEENTGSDECLAGCWRVHLIMILFIVHRGIWGSEEFAEWQWQLAFFRRQTKRKLLAKPFNLKLLTNYYPWKLMFSLVCVLTALSSISGPQPPHFLRLRHLIPSQKLVPSLFSSSLPQQRIKRQPFELPS